METQTTPPSSSAPSRKRRTAAEKAEILHAFEQSGLSAKAFCERQGLSVATLANWRRRQRESDGPGFVCLDLPGPGADAATVRFPNGLEFRAPLTIPPDALAAWCERLYRIGS